ncbi:acetyl/propionyl/methylcrotonyl-CoA carboxylase subunit alpha [Inquilinus sp. Marseille-Q2685]|uniref:acetyl/propionyl/methylcrotonyl-CoA carboxylase subunit alpha n=1 Tax=Inquilinus sp. Marseille-Q2685 TaxID=2866581 RepID=UPI001CE488B3|nr:acetyl/propionyl/methylcrotonyl-CoA carboxylase subunit alpha [Inquilinus sp. Marseille-Q2685]
MFDTLLIANRGEIACRVIRTARRLGLRTVAVHSDADAGARHVAEADLAVRIGPAPARDSYLKIDAILAAAKAAGAQAIHPGYGFLSENAAFAEACAEAGITFVGPPPSAIRAMGGKSEAKALMAAAGVPLVPGYHEADQDPARLAAEAAKIGFPVLIKASAGGGGKGMRVVERAEDFAAQLAGAQREAASSFGNDRVLIERYLARPRHVEIQVFADGHGNCVYLFERDCSIQRRHQKVVEEAPAPGLDPAIRKAMGEAAVAAAKAIGYVGAGTVEFLLDTDGRFYFMEMNTRLQVEHPVTEAITGLDVVEWQLLVAAGGTLPLGQDDLAINGAAIEVRLYAEDPQAGFLPQTGRLAHLALPEAPPHVRIDSGVRQGDAISIHYDPMIAKLIVWDHDRPAAVRRLARALDQARIAGLATNLDFLRAIARHPAFAAAELDTGFIARHGADLLPPPAPASSEDIALAALGLVLGRDRDRSSPWALADGWRLNDESVEMLRLTDRDAEIPVAVRYRRHGGLSIGTPDGPVEAGGTLVNGELTARLGDRTARATIVVSDERIAVLRDSADRVFGVIDPLAHAGEEAGAGSRLTAPMPGRVIAVLVEAGAKVTKGQPLIVLEAMKMEHTVAAPADGTVTSLPFSAGDQVDEGVALIGFEAA